MRQRLFESAILKLTGWYLLVLAIISLMFSIVLYQVSIAEVERRLERYQEQSQMLYHPPPQDNLSSPDTIRNKELISAKANVILVLVYTNIVVLLLGGVVSYLFARKTLEPIEAAHEQQARFISDASHELRTPLAAMTTELEVALRDPSLTKKEMRELLESNLEEVQRLTKLSHTLLSLSTGKDAKLAFTPIDLTKAILSARKKTQVPDSRIHVMLPKSSTFVTGNEESIRELIAILLDNALKYSPEDSTVRVQLRENNGRAEVSISNKGRGILPDELPQIFDRFYRSEASRSSEGYGLGLSLARQISDLHQANLSVSSEPGVITTFEFSLPITHPRQQS